VSDHRLASATAPAALLAVWASAERRLRALELAMAGLVALCAAALVALHLGRAPEGGAWAAAAAAACVGAILLAGRAARAGWRGRPIDPAALAAFEDPLRAWFAPGPGPLRRAEVSAARPWSSACCWRVPGMKWLASSGRA
jgi:hypothetical protein